MADLSCAPRSVRESEDDEDEDERKQNRGCTLQYQHSTLQVFTQFHTTSSEGTDQVITMLGPDWLVEVTDLVSDFMKVDDPRVAQLVDSSTLAGREPGTTLFKVRAPHPLSSGHGESRGCGAGRQRRNEPCVHRGEWISRGRVSGLMGTPAGKHLLEVIRDSLGASVPRG